MYSVNKMKNIKILCNRKYNGKNNATRHCLQHERQQTHVIQTIKICEHLRLIFLPYNLVP